MKKKEKKKEIVQHLSSFQRVSFYFHTLAHKPLSETLPSSQNEAEEAKVLSSLTFILTEKKIKRGGKNDEIKKTPTSSTR